MSKQIRFLLYRAIKSGQSFSDATQRVSLQHAATELGDCLNLPHHFAYLLLAIEDKRFLSHRGVDFFASIRAVLSNLEGVTSLQGASTITQQLYGIREERRGKRRRHNGLYKVQQSLWAIDKERRSNKQAILSEYLNKVYWGRSYYGLAAAAEGYFASGVPQLTIAQSFFLVERLATPNLMFAERVIELLTRPSVWSLFVSDASRLDELMSLYDVQFQGGEVLCRFRERLFNR